MPDRNKHAARAAAARAAERASAPESTAPRGAPTHTTAHGTSFSAKLRNSFITGVVVAGPLAITAYLAKSFLEWVDATVKPMVPLAWNPDSYLPFAIPGFGLVVALIGFTMLGALTASLVGRTLLSYGEDLLDRTPLIRPVYKTLKQVFETFVANRDSSFRQVGLIEWPRPGIHTIVFVAGPVKGEIARRVGIAHATRRAEAEALIAPPLPAAIETAAADGGRGLVADAAQASTAGAANAVAPQLAPTAGSGALPDIAEEILAVFIPTTPNPTGGYLMFLPARDVIILDMGIEDAAKYVISGGIVAPGAEAGEPPRV